METETQLALFAEPSFTCAPVTIGIGSAGNRIIFDADPADGTIHISTDCGTEIELNAYEFGVVTELLLLAADPE